MSLIRLTSILLLASSLCAQGLLIRGAGGGGGGGTRQNYWTATEGATTTTSSTFTDAETLTFTPDANSDYLILASWDADPEDSGHSEWRLYHDTATTEAMSYVHRSTTATQENRQDMAMMVSSFGASPSSNSWKIQFRDIANFLTQSIFRRRIFALKLGSEDEHNTLSSAYSTTSDAYQDGHSLTFTPATTGDYLILAIGQCAKTGTGDPLVQLKTDGTVTAADTRCTDRGASPSRQAFFGAMIVVTLTNSSKTINLQVKSSVSGQSVGFDAAAIVALRLDDFASSATAEDHTGGNTTSGTFVDALTTSPSLFSGEDYLFLGSLIGYQENGDSVEYQWNVGGTTYAQPDYDPVLTTSEGSILGSIFRGTASGPTTMDLKYRQTGSQTVHYTDAVLVALRLENP